MRRGVGLPLIQHDWLVLRRSLAVALPEWRDWLIAAAIAALAIGLVHAQGPQAVLGDWRAAAAIGALAGWKVAVATVQRLGWHRAEGVLAFAALAPSAARAFIAAGLSLGAALLIIAGLAARPDALVALLPGFAGGALLGLVTPRIGELAMPRAGWRRGDAAGTPGRIVAATQMPLGWSLAGGGVLVLLALASGLAAWLSGSWAPFVLAAGAALPLLLLGRVDHALVRFLALSGYDARRSAALHLAASAVYVALVAAVAVCIDMRGLAAVLLIGLGFGCYTAFRVWAYRAQPRRSADTKLVFMFFGAALAGVLLPPLLLILLPYLGIQLYRRAVPASWSLA